MQISVVECRSILTRSTGYLKRVCSHSMNPYTGCGLGKSACGAACYVRFNPWLTRGREWGGFVDVKTNAAEVYRRTADAERRWAHKRSQPFSIFLSSSTEPWQAVEKTYRITRSLLDALLDAPPDELILQTHTTGIREDLARVQALSKLCRLRVHVSIEGDTGRLPGMPPPPSRLEDRIRLLRELSDAGIIAVACMAPLYPVNDPDAFFKKLAKTGIVGVVIDHFIEGDGTPDGARTLKTPLPPAMARVNPDSIYKEYRDHMAAIAVRYLPVGISSEGFSGEYRRTLPSPGS
ncbi:MULTISPECIES: hypothetical protein [unclassified Nitrospina]|uniref:hypothetical protein n=1 Tax=unclassified Nitrospina TaxID=2638683 RepID=UPI003F953A53